MTIASEVADLAQQIISRPEVSAAADTVNQALLTGLYNGLSWIDAALTAAAAS